MKKIIFLFLIATSGVFAQNAGGLNASALSPAGHAYVVGEIYVIPQNPNHTSAGTVAIASQILFSTLGTNDYIVSGDVKYYPNPTKDFVTIELPESVDLSKAELYDLKGAKAQFHVTSNTVNITTLPAGIYILTFPDTKIKSIKIVKN
ncbi:T9SS type A sorting domain-containing protein [Flavobacterium sp. J372]|uniref:T9SS type A sorting domain-containing protein n=1 Tax=Flavobacterium sp. J372 TaxID=2898436 RepID=UPI00215131BC|nr:T9SS type A sorting domain-containing protein [Flavobacterium sp. J372]MCR5861278.1 T9SS type A sorting domain-containing protein [Flavobacterium sp. J372]MCR5863670.1 T9SS type A sorting domain-containing protein [Flavobacterium sp. J372]